MKRLITPLILLAMILWPVIPVGAQGVGIFSRPDCTTITSPVTGQTFCFDQTRNTINGWDGTGWQSNAGLALTTIVVTDPRWGADPTGVASSSAAFQAAIAANRHIFIPCGTYRITAQTLVNVSNVWIQGSGECTILRFSSSLSLYAFNLASTTSISGIKLSDFACDGQGFTNGCVLQSSATSTLSFFEITRLYVTNFTNALGPAISISNGLNGSINMIRCQLAACINAGGASVNVSIVGNSLRACTDSCIGAIGGSTTSPTHISIVGNTIDTSSVGQGIEVLRGTNITIAGNTIRAANARGIYVWDGALGAGFESRDVTITGNTVRASGQEGIGLNRVLRAVVTGNTCSGNTGSGMLIQNNADRFTVSGNTCMNNATYGIYIASSTNGLVTGNVASDDQGVATQVVGINVFGATANQLSIIGNTARGNTTAQIRFEAGIIGTNVNYASGNTVTGTLQYDDRIQAIPVIDLAAQHVKGLTVTDGGGGQVGSPTGGDKGAGTINAATNYYLAGVQTVKPAGADGTIRPTGFTFANIGTALTTNGDFGYCSDCTIANPCASGGTGAIAKRLNNVNVCN